MNKINFQEICSAFKVDEKAAYLAALSALGAEPSSAYVALYETRKLNPEDAARKLRMKLRNNPNINHATNFIRNILYNNKNYKKLSTELQFYNLTRELATEPPSERSEADYHFNPSQRSPASQSAQKPTRSADDGDEDGGEREESTGGGVDNGGARLLFDTKFKLLRALEAVLPEVDGKDRAAILVQLSKLQNFDDEKTDEKRQVHYYLPVSCNSCPFFLYYRYNVMTESERSEADGAGGRDNGEPMIGGAPPSDS